MTEYEMKQDFAEFCLSDLWEQSKSWANWMAETHPDMDPDEFYRAREIVSEFISGAILRESVDLWKSKGK